MTHLRVIDIIAMPSFEEHIEDCIDEIREQRIKSGIALFKRGPLERLQEKGEYNAKKLTELYADALDGALDSSKYPSTVRSFIKLIGDEAYRRTIAELTKNNEQNQESKA